MNEVVVRLTDEEMEDVELLAELLDRPIEEAVRIVLTTGAAWVAQRKEGGSPDTVIRVMIHSLLNIPRITTEAT